MLGAIDMKVYKTKEGHYTFKKNKYKSADKIRELYEEKLDIPQEKQGKDLPQDIREAYVTNDGFGSFLRLRRVKDYDPRYPTTFFTTKKATETGYMFAERLHNMTDKEFLYSGLPYTFLDEIGSKNIRNFDSLPLREAGEDKENKRKTVYILLGLLLLAGWFYWFQYRPVKTRSHCDWKARNKWGAVTKYYDREYKACLHEKGLR